MLDWKSPLKAEPNYSRATQNAYLGTPPSRSQRLSDVFPFWPGPRGSLAPNLVIQERVALLRVPGNCTDVAGKKAKEKKREQETRLRNRR